MFYVFFSLKISFLHRLDSSIPNATPDFTAASFLWILAIFLVLLSNVKDDCISEDGKIESRTFHVAKRNKGKKICIYNIIWLFLCRQRVAHILGKQLGPSEHYSACNAVLPALVANGSARPQHIGAAKSLRVGVRGTTERLLDLIWGARQLSM